MEDRSLDNASLAAGAADYLPKGEITPSLLERTIRHALERQRLQQLLREQELLFHNFTIDGEMTMAQNQEQVTQPQKILRLQPALMSETGFV